MKISSFLASAIVVMCASAADAQQSDSQTAAPGVTTAAAADPNEMICEYEAPETGTLLGRVKVCKTRRQWDTAQKQTEIGRDLHDATKFNNVAPR